MADGCTCPSPETDWSPDLPCGGISTTTYRNGRLAGKKEPPLCEVHMKPWGHRRGCPTHDPRVAQDHPDGSTT